MDRPHDLLIPGLVNAHTHLDLTHVGPQPFDPTLGFAAWGAMVRAGRTDDPDRIFDSVVRGARLSQSAGVVLVGDIAGAPPPLARSSLIPALALARVGLPAVSFLEFFSIGPNLWSFASWLNQTLALARARCDLLQPSGVHVGLSPHAPYSVDRRSFAWAAALARELRLPIATHLAESLDEQRFIAQALGPMRDFLASLNLWDHHALTHPAGGALGRGQRPVSHLAPALVHHPSPIAVHVNDCSDDDLRVLSQLHAHVVYCPRASQYFNAPAHFGPHRVADMLRAGVPVSLGSDSVINLPAASMTPADGDNESDFSARGISVFDEGKLVHQLHGLPPVQILRMMTTTPALSLGFDPACFRFIPGGLLAGVAAVVFKQPPSSTPRTARDLLELAFAAESKSVGLSLSASLAGA